jgi:tRNA isopentenyl-2-thiomethyl-A-37 hydroxylase MiaE
MRAVHIMTKFDTIWNSKYKWSLIAEMLICLVTTYPFLIDITITQSVDDFAVIISYELNHFLLVLSFLRMYIVGRYLLVSSKYMTARAY